MTHQIAKPGELTCLDEECAWSGLTVAADRQTCDRCHGPLGRVPERPSMLAAGRPAQPLSAPANPGAKRLLLVVVVAVLLVCAMVAVNSGILQRITGSKYKVGDCVTVRASVLHGSDLDRAECNPNKFSGNPMDIVYRVDAVKPGKNASCPGGYDRITFSDEPENTTYCLTMYKFG